MKYIRIIAVPQSGIYYIQNKYSQKYADIEGPSTAEGAIVQQWEFHTGSQEKWQIEHVYNSGGYVRLKSLYSGKYLGVVQSDLSKIKQLSSQGDTTLWRFELLDDYSVKMICKASEAYSKVLAVPLNSTGNGADLTQRAYTDDNDYSDEWYMLNTTGSEVFLLGINNTGHDHYTALGKIMTPLTQLGFNSIGYTITDNIDDGTVINRMANSRIFVSRSHARSDELGSQLQLFNTTGNSMLDSNEIYDFTNNRVLVDLRLS